MDSMNNIYISKEFKELELSLLEELEVMTEKE